MESPHTCVPVWHILISLPFSLHLSAEHSLHFPYHNHNPFASSYRMRAHAILVMALATVMASWSSETKSTNNTENRFASGNYPSATLNKESNFQADHRPIINHKLAQLKRQRGPRLLCAQCPLYCFYQINQGIKINEMNPEFEEQLQEYVVGP